MCQLAVTRGATQHPPWAPHTSFVPPAYIQVDNLQLSSGSRGVNNGAWGVWVKNGADTLIKGLNAQARMVRDIAVQGLQPGTVIVNSE